MARCPDAAASEFDRIATIPNFLTLARLLLVPALWFFAVAGDSEAVALGLILAGATDAADGWFARRLNQMSSFGSRFDSIADTLIIRSGILWLLLLERSLFSDHPMLIGAWLVLDNSVLIFGYLKFRRIGNLHLYSSKIAGILLYAFTVHALLTAGYSEAFLAAAAWCAIIGCVESLFILISRNHIDEHIGSIAFALRRGRPGSSGASGGATA